MTEKLSQEEMNEEIEFQKHLEDCKKGIHRFIECDDLEPTCIFCGKFN